MKKIYDILMILDWTLIIIGFIGVIRFFLKHA